MTPVIKLQNISKTFKSDVGKSTVALKNIDLEISEGEFFVFLGPSGSGKSTLLKIINGFEPPSSGKITLRPDINLTDFSFIFQQFALFPWLTVRRNIELGIIARDFLKSDLERIVKTELKRMGLEKFAEAYPKELSGGMRQRVGIGRALAQKPKIIFMDEPFSELDSFTAEELRQELLKIWRDTKLTIIMVTHLIEEALELADRIAIMTPLPGQIEKILTNNLPRPRNKRSPKFYRLYDEIYRLIKP